MRSGARLMLHRMVGAYSATFHRPFTVTTGLFYKGHVFLVFSVCTREPIAAVLSLLEIVLGSVGSRMEERRVAARSRGQS